MTSKLRKLYYWINVNCLLNDQLLYTVYNANFSLSGNQILISYFLLINFKQKLKKTIL